MLISAPATLLGRFHRRHVHGACVVFHHAAGAENGGHTANRLFDHFEPAGRHPVLVALVEERSRTRARRSRTRLNLNLRFRYFVCVCILVRASRIEPSLCARFGMSGESSFGIAALLGHQR